MLNSVAPFFRARYGRTISVRTIGLRTIGVRTAGFCCALLAGAALVAAPRPAQADAFATVPAGDVLYEQLATIGKAGWRGNQSNAATDRADESQPPLTRYEMALETAKAIFAVNAHQHADSTWLDRAPRPALRALRALTLALAGDLKKLDVDVRGALDSLDAELRLPLGTPHVAAPAALPETTPDDESANVGPVVAPRSNGAMVSGAQRQVILPLSQRLRLQTAFTALERESDDPFGDSSLASLLAPDPHEARNGLAGSARLDAIYDVGNALSLRAGMGRTTPDGSVHSIEDLALRSSPSLFNASAQRTMGGGLDLRVHSGLKFSGDVSRVTTDGPNGVSALSYGGGVGLSAWQNRLSLSANLSRLVPEERSMLLAQTATAFNLDVGMTDRLRLKLLYQQWFGVPTETGAQHMVAGGINLSF